MSVHISNSTHHLKRVNSNNRLKAQEASYMPKGTVEPPPFMDMHQAVQEASLSENHGHHSF